MAKRHDFRYFFHEGLNNMFSHGFMSFAAIEAGRIISDETGGYYNGEKV